jgi:hypothetical protein
MSQQQFLVQCDCIDQVTAEAVQENIGAAIAQWKANVGLSGDEDEGRVEVVTVDYLPPASGAVHLTEGDYALLEKLCGWALTNSPFGGSNLKTVLDGDLEDGGIDALIKGSMSLHRIQAMAQQAQLAQVTYPPDPEDAPLTAADYQAALDAQNACNASGILGTMARVKPRIWSEVRANGGGTQGFNQHPIMVLYTTTLMSLAGLGIADSAAYSRAVKAAEEKTKG